MDRWEAVWIDFKNGDTQAIGKIYNTYVDILFRYGSKISTDRELVKDCIQQLFLELISSKKLGNPSNIEFYLLKGLKRIIINQLKTKIKRQELNSEDLHAFEIKFDHHDAQSNNESQIFDLLDEELKKLSAKKKELLFLKFYSGLNNKEIGKIVGLNSGTVQKQIYRLLQQFRDQFKHKMIVFFSMCYTT